MSVDYIRRKGTQKKRETKIRGQRGLFGNGSQFTKAIKTKLIITRTRHHNMFNCFHNIWACGTLVGGRNPTFIQGLIETGSVEPKARYNRCIRGREKAKI